LQTEKDRPGRNPEANIKFKIFFHTFLPFAIIRLKKEGLMQIGEIEKGKDKIIVTVKEFKSKQYIDVRTYFENDEGEWIPTKKGISFTPENLSDAIKLLQKAEKKVAEKEA
jgi:hypothetical protein